MSEPVARTVDDWGRVLLAPDTLMEALYAGVDVAQVPVQREDELTLIYNAMCEQFDKTRHMLRLAEPLAHSPDDEHVMRADAWRTPELYASIDVRDHVLAFCESDVECDRVRQEMDLFEARGLLPVLRACIWLVDHFRSNNIVWGVGRGSSVASYVLFLIGVHKIDSIRYGLDIKEFLK